MVWQRHDNLLGIYPLSLFSCCLVRVGRDIPFFWTAARRERICLQMLRATDMDYGILGLTYLGLTDETSENLCYLFLKLFMIYTFVR